MAASNEIGPSASMRLRGLNRVKGRNGAIYYYHRASGRRIDAPWGSADFVAKLARIEREHKSGASKSRAAAGTWGALVEAYRKSPEFAALAARTRGEYNNYLDWLAPILDLDLEEITPPSLIKLRDKFAGARSWSTANRLLRVIALIFAWGLPRGIVSSNPARGVPRIKRPRDLVRANRPWTPQELDVVLRRARTEIAAAVALGAFAAMREGDVLRLTWSAYDGQSIAYRQGKTGGEVWMPAHKRLRAILDRLSRQAATIVTTEPRGRKKLTRAYTSDGFRAVFFKLLGKLEAEGVIGASLTFHGLRHTAATYLAEAGCDAATIQAITGHASQRALEIYTLRADRRQRAVSAITAMEKAQAGNKNLQNKMTLLQTAKQ